MPRRAKDEDRVETIIRGLLKQPENRRCINCNSLGPQYVCTTFYTFVCTICSGVHREFTHRVKSVSMAKFSEEEIASLQAGGNERAREIYFRAWDPVRDSYPDGSKLGKLREFIKGVYIDRNYAGENKRPGMSDRSSSGSREDLSGRGSFDQSSPFKKGGGLTFRDFMEERSPRRNRSAAHFEIVDDRFRDDGGVKRYERGFSSRSLASQGEKAPPLRIEGPPKSSEKKSAAEARVPVVADEPQKQKKAVRPTSLIDFDAKSEITENPSQPQEAATNSEKNNETSSVASPTHQRTPNPPDKKSLEYMLFDMSDDPVSLPSTGASQIPATAKSDGSPQSVNDNSKDPTVQTTQPSAAYGEALYNQVLKSPEKLQNEKHGIQLQHSNKPSTSTDLAVVPSVPLKQSSQTTDQEEGSKPVSRKEIPQELFSSDFGSFAPAAGGWQMHQPYGARYGMQFRPNAMPVAGFPNPSRPKNPFDIGEDGFQTQAPMFPSTALIAQPSPYSRAMPPHMSPYGMNMPRVPGAYMGQLPNNNPHTRPQVDANIAEGGDAFAYHNPTNQTSGSSFSSTAPNQSSRTGNPFG